MRYYELMYVSDPAVDGGSETLKQKIESIVSDHEGTITSFDKLGKKRLAYPIAKRQYGIYNLVNIQGKPTIVAALDTFLRLNSQVFRHIILVFSEKTLNLRSETQRIQVEEDERMRRGGRPLHELSAEDKEKIKNQMKKPIIDPLDKAQLDGVKAKDVVAKSESESEAAPAAEEPSSEPTAPEKDEKVVEESTENSSSTDDDKLVKETAE